MANYYLESIVVNELLKRDIGHIHIVSSLNTSFLEANISSSERFTYHERVLDTGGYQSTPLDVDMLKTLENYYEKIHCHREAILIAEVKFLKEMKVDAVLVDSVPLACLAGKLAGARVTLVSNFSWDFIFQGMLESLPAATPRYSEYAEMVVQCSIDYQSVDHYLQLPGNTPTLSSSILANKIIPCPLVSRTAKQSAGKVRQELISRVSVKRESMTCNDTKESISADCPAESVAAESASSSNILLLSFGGHSTTSFHLCDEMLPAGWVCCTLGFKESELPQDSHRFVALPLDSYVPDLVNAADVVIGKIGYGTVSECLSTVPPTPLIFVPRTGWPEESYLIELLMQHQMGVVLERESYLQGHWSEAIQESIDIARHQHLDLDSVNENKVTPTQQLVDLIWQLSSRFK